MWVVIYYRGMRLDKSLAVESGKKGMKQESLEGGAL